MNPSTPLIATCETCHFVIAAHAGAVWIDMAEVREVLRQLAHGGELPVTQTGTWHVQHWACIENEPAEIYDVLVLQLETYGGYQERARHLGSKSWFRFTDWSRLLHVAPDESSALLGRVA